MRKQKTRFPLWEGAAHIMKFVSCSHRSQVNGSRVGEEAEGDDPPHTDEREDEARPFLIGDVCHGEVGHGGTGRRGDAVRESIAEGEGEDGGLPGKADDVSERCHDRHGNGCLPGAGGDKEIEAVLNDEHAEGNDGGWENVEHAGEVVDDGIHDPGIIQKDGGCLTHSDCEAGKHHAFAAFEEGVADVIRVQAADDAGEDAHDEEHRGDFIHIEVKFQHADDDADEVQSEKPEADGLAGGEFFCSGKIDRIPFQEVDLIDRAALRILLHFVGVVHDIENIHCEEHDEDAHAVGQTGEDRDTCDALRDADGEWLGAAGAVTGSHRAEEHAERSEGVEAKRECDAHDERCEGEVFLVASGECREGGERGHEDRDQEDAPILQLFDESTEPCHDGTGLGEDIERAAHHEEEGDDADAALEAFIDRREEIEKSCRFLRYIVEVGRVDDHFAGLNVLDSVIDACGDDVARDGAEYNDAHQYDDRAGCFECFHLIFHLIFHWIYFSCLFGLVG